MMMKALIRARSIEVSLQTDKGKLQVQFGDCMLEVGEEPKKAPAGGAPRVVLAPARLGSTRLIDNLEIGE